MDPFRVALADKEHNRRSVGRRVVRQPLLPIGRDLVRFGCDRVDVGGKRERDDIGVEAVDHGARLRAGAAVRGLDRHRLARVRFPLLRERLIDRTVEFARRIIGDIEERRVGKGPAEAPRPTRAARARASVVDFAAVQTRIGYLLIKSINLVYKKSKTALRKRSLALLLILPL